jgi:hypothetical protein
VSGFPVNDPANDLENDMNATVTFPSQLNWTSEQLADAVPLRLHQLFAFDAQRDGAIDSANAQLPPRQSQSRNYLPATPAPDVFRVR